VKGALKMSLKRDKGGTAATEHNRKPTKSTEQLTDPNLTAEEITNLKYWATQNGCKTYEM
jgi:hypothetical protein